MRQAGSSPEMIPKPEHGMVAAGLQTVRWCTGGDRPFWATTAATVLFFLLQDGFFTLDGWAHSANARLMLARCSDAPYLEGFVRFNPVPVPNWAGHALIAGLMAVFPPLFAEKVHWALLVLALASGGHRVVRAWSRMTDARALLLLPVLLGQLFVFGFYNFLWGVAASLWCAAWWCRSPDRWHRWVILPLCTALVWSCHGSCVFFFFALIVAMETASLRPFPFRRMLGTLVAFTPAFVALWYFNTLHEQDWSGFTIKELALRLARMEWSVWYDGSREWVMSLTLGIAMLIGVFFALHGGAGVRDRRRWPLPVLAIVFLIAYFMIPDNTGYANFISVRLASVFALMLALWVCVVPSFPRSVTAAIGGLAVVALVGKLDIAAKEGAQARKDRDVLMRAATSMRPGDVVLPVWRDDRWLYQHRADVLGMSLPLRLLENSECNKRYFPLVWDEALPEAFRKVAYYEDPCSKGMLEHMRSGMIPAVDHIVFMGNRLDTSECAVHGLLGLADSLGYRIAFAEADVRVLSRR
jgi:hypothetical protein